MKIIIGLVMSLMFCGAALADVAAPPVGEQIQIELSGNYSDYQFYLCSYDLEVQVNPNPPHPSRPTMIVKVPNTFQMKKINLSTDKPFIEPTGKSRINYRGSDILSKALYLVAIKKSDAAKFEPEIEKNIDSNNYSNGNIKFVRLEDSLEIKEGKGAKVIVNQISIDEKGMNVKEKEGGTIISGVQSCLSLGFALTAVIVFAGLWGTRKKRRKG